MSEKIINKKAPKKYVEDRLEELAPVTIGYDISYLPEKEKQVVNLLVKASQYMDDIFREQVCESNAAIYDELKNSPEDKPYLDLFELVSGPWDRFNNDKPFINSAPKLKGANFYPADMCKEEFNEWIETHPEDREAFESGFTVIRRDGDKLVAIPYNDYFKKELAPAANLLRQAADLTSDQTLEKYLKGRANAFSSDDYYQSDLDWMNLSGDIEVVIGPYELYEDKLFGCKTSYESFVCVVDHKESEKLKQVGKYVGKMEANLPIPDKHKNFEKISSPPLKVVNELYSAGKVGMQTMAFNLPNDERVTEEKGTKNVLLKNVMNAKFDKIIYPLMEGILAEQDLNRVSFDAFFNHILLHEISHGLGPNIIVVDGKETTPNKELKEYYTTVEECKADVLGVYNVRYLIDNEVLPEKLKDSLYPTTLGDMLRSIRMGLEKAHGGSNAIQLNYYIDKGAVQVTEDNRFFVDDREMKKAVCDLAHKVLMIEAEGDYQGAKEFIEEYKIVKPEVKNALDKLKKVPVDLKPSYSIENDV